MKYRHKIKLLQENLSKYLEIERNFEKQGKKDEKANNYVQGLAFLKEILHNEPAVSCAVHKSWKMLLK